MSPVQIVWYLNIAATVILLGRLSVARLILVYRWLALYLLVDAVQDLVRISLQSDLNRSAEVYMLGQALKVILSVYVVLELCWAALAPHPALARFARNFVGYALAGAALFAGLGLYLDPSTPPAISKILFYFLSFERTMDIGVLFFLLLIIAYMTWFPVKIKRNVAVYIFGFVVYFTGRFVFLLAIMRAVDTPARQAFADRVNFTVLCMSLLCLSAWVVALRKEGEETTTVIGHRWNPAAMERLSRQLEALNDKLMRISKRGRNRKSK